MKTKAYKLAAELGLNEDRVLEWLRANGYPNARRADTIRAEVVQAARRALGRRGVGAKTTRVPRGGRHPNGRVDRPTRPTGSSAGALRVSFAELLEGHLPPSEAPRRRTDTVPSMPPVPVPARAPAPSRPPPNAQAAAINARRLEGERDEARRSYAALRAHSELQTRELVGLRESLSEARRNLSAVEALRVEVDRLQMERSRLRQALNEAGDERETLAQTCVELQEALLGARESLNDLEHEQGTQATAAGDLRTDLDAARQREMAWRARALELERVSQAGASFSALLQAEGLTQVSEHLRVVAALVGAEDSGRGFLRALRHVDAAALRSLLQGRVVRCCADPICGQVVALDEGIPLRVDSPARCAICEGDEGRRWFVRMVRECQRAGVRRLLLVGGSEETHEVLRGLSQGHPVDLRLVSAQEEATEARVQGRVEGCDVLVTWSSALVPRAVTEPYCLAADQQDTRKIEVLGVRWEVAAMARAVANRLARTHLLRAR